MTQPILSILVITHNQRELLKRCLDSVLGQKLNAPFEVIVSDDRSDDGTAEYIAELQEQIQSGKKEIENLQELVYTRCNSNDCQPTNVSERCGWNKLNAWRHAKGKYMVNIDADDYLRHDDLYQLQIDMLEAHPECSMCQQHVWIVNDGEAIEQGHVSYLPPMMKDGAVVSMEQVLTDGLRGLNQSYMMRRNPNDDMVALYGKHYDDTVITYHHLQYGLVVFLDRADYVWVQYPKSISHDMTNDDQLITYGLLPLHHAELFPKMRSLFMRSGLKDLIHLFKHAPQYPNLSQQYIDFLKQFDGFIFLYHAETKHSFYHRIKYKFIRGYMLMLSRFKWTNDCWYAMLYRLLK